MGEYARVVEGTIATLGKSSYESERLGTGKSKHSSAMTRAEVAATRYIIRCKILIRCTLREVGFVVASGEEVRLLVLGAA